MNKDDVKILKKETVYDGFFKMLKYHLRHRLFSGQWSDEFTREIFNRSDAVCVLLYDPKQDTVVLLEQFRAGALHREFSPWLFEIVAGVFEPHETPEDVAVREVKEEAGVDVGQLHYMCDYLSSPGGIAERIYIYYSLIDASQVQGVFGLASEQEDIKVHVVSRRRAYNWVKSGKIKNGMAIIALQWLQLNWKKFSAYAQDDRL